MGKLQVNGIIQATGSLVTGSKFSLTKTAATKSTATDQDLVINYNLPSSTSLTDSNAPGIGFHVGNTCWGQMVYNNGFKFYNGGDFSSLTNVYANNFIGNLSGNATSASAAPWSGITGKPSTFPPSSHTHDYLPLAGGGTLTGSAVINFPAGSVSVAASTPMSLSYGRLACYGTLCINANTDNSGTEYVILTAGKGLSSSTEDGLAIGTSTLTWQNNAILTAGNYTSYTVTKTGSGASGTWGINVTGSAGSVAWGNVTGKPSTFTPSSHNHTSLTGITSLDFSTHSDDGATIKTTIDNKNTYLDFYLVDDGESDLFRWNFGRWDSATSSQNNVTLMTLTCAQNANTAKLVVNGTIQGSLDWSYITNKPSSFTPSSHTHSYLPLSGGTVTGTITSNAAMPFMFNGAGSSTYTCACMYVNSGGMIFETPRAGNDISYAPLPFRVVSRGGWEGGYYAPLYCQKVIVQNYGGSLPSSGVTGEIFYKT